MDDKALEQVYQENLEERIIKYLAEQNGLSLEDADAMFKNWANDEEVTKYLTWSPHGTEDVTKEILKQWVDSYKDEKYYQWAIVLKEIDEPIGSI